VSLPQKLGRTKLGRTKLGGNPTLDNPGWRHGEQMEDSLDPIQ